MVEGVNQGEEGGEEDRNVLEEEVKFFWADFCIVYLGTSTNDKLTRILPITAAIFFYK